MKKIICFALLVFFAQSNLLAQAYAVTYEKEFTPDVGNQLDQIKDPVIKAQIQKQLVQVKLYELLHKKGTSTFTLKEEEGKGEKDEFMQVQGQRGKANVTFMELDSGEHPVLYKSLGDGRYLKSANIMGKDFLIKDALPQHDWRLEEETKAIGNYICKKAVTILNGKEVTAWYTPSIPIKDGPDEYYGLPGLIIELASNDTKYHALSVKEVANVDIVKPAKGKEIAKADYKKLHEERMEALKQQFKHH